MFLSTELPSKNVTTIEIESKIKWMGRGVGWCGPVLGLGILLSWFAFETKTVDSVLLDILGCGVILLPSMVAIWWLGPWVAKSVQKEKWYHNLWKAILAALVSLFTSVIAIIVMSIAGVVTKEVSRHSSLLGAIGDIWTALGLTFVFGSVPAILASLICLLVLHIGIKRIYATSGVVSAANQD